jgi:hypothetical protein
MSTLEDVARHAVDFWLSTEDLPRRTTASRCEQTATSARVHGEQPGAKKRLYAQLKSMLGHLGMHHDHLIPRTPTCKNDDPVAGWRTRPARVRFGRDPATSVLDADCKAHELDNLYVVDTSFFPSIGAVNPALTAMATPARRRPPARTALVGSFLSHEGGEMSSTAKQAPIRTLIPPRWIACDGRRSIPGWWRGSAAPGCSTASRSRSRARSPAS